MGKLFGTDGVRGIPGAYPLVPGLVRKLGFVSAALLRERRQGRDLNGSSPLILMGRDSRASGAALGRSLAHGFARAGCLTADLGMLPTPALAHLTPRRRALCGVMISASHNPAEFNGIKFFTADGFKLPLAIEDEIERRLEAAADPGAGAQSVLLSRRPRRTYSGGGGAQSVLLSCRPRRTYSGGGGASSIAGRLPDAEAVEQYLGFLRSTFPPERGLEGLRIVVDCAHGAASRLAPRLLRGLGAEAIAIGCEPNGANINQGCGALEPAAMRREVVRRRARCGVSLDGDADRAIFADETGALCNGDVLIGMAAMDLHERRLLKGRAVVLTVMSNFGLIQFLRHNGINALCVPVGDRNVTDAIEKNRLSLGGESSGHIVFRRYSPTGDGLLTALQILAVLVQSGRPLSWFRKRYRSFPQVLANVRVEHRVPLEQLPRTRAAIRAAEERLRGQGRVLVRYSGTEPLVRILVEGPDRNQCRALSVSLADTFRKERIRPRE